MNGFKYYFRICFIFFISAWFSNSFSVFNFHYHYFLSFIPCLLIIKVIQWSLRQKLQEVIAHQDHLKPLVLTACLLHPQVTCPWCRQHKNIHSISETIIFTPPFHQLTRISLAHPKMMPDGLMLSITIETLNLSH